MKHVSNENTSYYCDAACAQFWGFRSEYKKKKRTCEALEKLVSAGLFFIIIIIFIFRRARMVALWICVWWNRSISQTETKKKRGQD